MATPNEPHEPRRRKSPRYRLRPKSHAETVDSLRRDLGKERPEPKPRPPERIRLLGAVPRGELIENLQVLVQFVDRGRCAKVGRVMATRIHTLGVMWWGGDATEHVHYNEIAAVRLLAAHSWDTYHAVAVAQRAHECSDLIGRNRRAAHR